jgi:TetR/AcrR family transcriptional repressor of nem operon
LYPLGPLPGAGLRSRPAPERRNCSCARHGYYASSIQDLVDCTGLGRGSIYHTFDSKRDLFIRALLRYIEARHQRLLARADDQPSFCAAILSVFECTIEECPDGCFIVNSSVELSPHDPEIAQFVSAALHDTEQFFRRLVDQGQTAGEFAATVDPALTAGRLLGMYLGLCVLIRACSGEAVGSVPPSGVNRR